MPGYVSVASSPEGPLRLQTETALVRPQRHLPAEQDGGEGPKGLPLLPAEKQEGPQPGGFGGRQIWTKKGSRSQRRDKRKAKVRAEARHSPARRIGRG